MVNRYEYEGAVKITSIISSSSYAIIIATLQDGEGIDSIVTKYNIPRNILSSYLNRLMKVGAIERPNRGEYKLTIRGRMAAKLLDNALKYYEEISYQELENVVPLLRTLAGKGKLSQNSLTEIEKIAKRTSH